MPTQNDSWLMEALMDIKQDIGEMKSIKGDVAELKNDVGSIASSVSTMRTEMASAGVIRQAQQTELQGMHTHMDALDTRVNTILMVDLVQLKQQLVVKQWFSSNRNKIIAALGAAALGIAANMAGSAIADKIKGQEISITPKATATGAAEKVAPASAPAPASSDTSVFHLPTIVDLDVID